jgi:hypothetical protein
MRNEMNALTDLPPPPAAPALEDCSVVELRDYTLRPGLRDVLVELFEREFVETQEACGMRLVAQFRDLDRPEHFVWMRGFADMAARRRGLEAFYGGPVWQRHRASANATMVDSDDVRLLRPARPAWAPKTPLLPRLRHDDDDASAAIYVLAVALRRESVDASLLRVFERDVLPAWRDAGAAPCAVYVTEPAENDFPRLPVRTEGHALVWLARLRDPAAWQAVAQRLADMPAWTRRALPLLERSAREPLAMRRLQPTRRSLLR